MVSTHNQPHRNGIKSLLLLSLPCLCLLMLGFWQSTRKQEFKLITEKVYISSLTPQERQRGWDTKVTVVMTYEGVRPRWQTAPFKPEEPHQSVSMDGELFYKKNGRYVKYIWPRSFKNMGFSPGGYDKSQDRFIANGFLDLSAIPAHLGALRYDVEILLYLTDLSAEPKQKLISSAKGTIIVRPR